MDYAKPADIVASMIDASEKKLALAPRDLLIRGAIAGAQHQFPIVEQVQQAGIALHEFDHHGDYVLQGLL